MKINEDFLPLVISPTEPVGNDRKKIWFQKGKNLFDENNIYNILYNKETPTSNDGWGMSDFIKVSSNTKYTMSSTLSSGQTTGQIQINEFDKSKNYITSTFSNVTLLEFTTNVATKYLRIGYRVDKQENIMLEQGNYTSYERYIEPQIFVRNSNGGYEEFTKKSEEVYSTSETKIGTWINGKPLYRKVYTGTKVSGSVSTISLWDLNIDYVNFYGFITGNQGGPDGTYEFPINYYENSDTFIRANIHRKYMNLTIVSAKSPYCNGDYKIVVEYTKTTD